MGAIKAFFANFSRGTRIVWIACGCFVLLAMLILIFLMLCPIQTTNASDYNQALIVTAASTDTTTSTTAETTTETTFRTRRTTTDISTTTTATETQAYGWSNTETYDSGTGGYNSYGQNNGYGNTDSDTGVTPDYGQSNTATQPATMPVETTPVATQTEPATTAPPVTPTETVTQPPAAETTPAATVPSSDDSALSGGGIAVN